MSLAVQILTALTVCPMVPAESKDALDVRQEAMVRAAVYEHRPEIASSPEFFFQGELIIPQRLTDLYKDHPQAVLDLLLKIMDGASPWDSVTAAGYAISFFDGPRVGLVCAQHFDKATYDVVDKDWETTPRQHWIKQVKRLREKAAGAK